MFKYKPSFLMVSCFEAYPRSEPVRTFASGRREVVLVIVNCGLSTDCLHGLDGSLVG